MWYGSSVLRHGRSRPWRRYQASSRRRKRRRSGVAGDRRGVTGIAGVSGASRIICVGRENLHAHRRRRRNVAVRRHPRQQGRQPRRRLRRCRRAECLARPGARRRTGSPISTSRSFASSATCSRSARSWPIRASGSRRAWSRRRSPTTTSGGSSSLIDRLETELPPLRRFILAGGAPAGAALHVARTVCRRAERRMVALDAGAGRRPDQVREPAVRSAVRARARRQPSRRRSRDRVVTGRHAASDHRV